MRASFSFLHARRRAKMRSAQALLKQSLKEDAEITITDSLLVTRQKPPSLAKFLSTSTVFRQTVGLQQQEHNIAFVKNFGWAPQRFNSRARPLARESRRWNIIFKALGEESQGSSSDRRILATGFLQELLGGEKSSRRLLRGLLADLRAEHYSCSATFDKSNSDPATFQSRAAAFLSGLEQLFLPEDFADNAFAYASIQLMQPGARDDGWHTDGGCSLRHASWTISGTRSGEVKVEGQPPVHLDQEPEVSVEDPRCPST